MLTVIILIRHLSYIQKMRTTLVLISKIFKILHLSIAATKSYKAKNKKKLQKHKFTATSP